MKELLRTLWKGRSLRHLPVAMREDEQGRGIRVVLEAGGRPPIDLSDAHVPVALRPLTLALCLRRGAEGGLGDRPVLRFLHAGPGETELGWIRLRLLASVRLQGHVLYLVQPEGSRNRCAPPLRRAMAYTLAWRHAIRTRGEEGLWMSPPDLRALDTYYIRPRPVFLVSVEHGRRRNIFPMDLVGPLPSGHFTLALRVTSPSVETIERSRRIAVSSIPAHYASVVYALGAHHRKESIDWDRLSFPMSPSAKLGIPVPDEAFRVRELQVKTVESVGSHAFFRTRGIGDEHRKSGVPQLCHVSAMYAGWMARRGTPMETA